MTRDNIPASRRDKHNTLQHVKGGKRRMHQEESLAPARSGRMCEGAAGRWRVGSSAAKPAKEGQTVCVWCVPEVGTVLYSGLTLDY